jgi:hypothetical protein
LDLRRKGWWHSGLWNLAVLWIDTDVSEEHTASIFKVEVYRFRNRLRGRWGFEEMGKEQEFAYKTTRCHNPEDHNTKELPPW